MEIYTQEMVKAKIYSYLLLFFYLRIIRQMRHDILNEVSSSVDNDKHLDEIKAEISVLIPRMRKLYQQLRKLQVIDNEVISSVDNDKDIKAKTKVLISRISRMREELFPPPEDTTGGSMSSLLYQI